jgi:imidazolonepropionase-like amidohydrolase
MMNKTSLFLKNGNFIDVIKGVVFPFETTVELEDGKIKKIHKLGSYKEKRDDKVIDLKGKYIIPGLFNTHIHTELNFPAILMNPAELFSFGKTRKKQIQKNLEDCLLRGITVIRDCATEDLNYTDDLNNSISNGEFLGPEIRQAVVVAMDGTAWAPTNRGIKERIAKFLSHMPFVPFKDQNSGVVSISHHADEQEVRAAVDEAVDLRGAQTIKLYDQRASILTYKPGLPLMPMSQLEVIVDQARKREIQTTMHCFSVESFNRGVSAGVDSIVHLPIDGHLSDDDISRFVSSGTILEPTISLALALCFNMDSNPNNPLQELKTISEFRRMYMGELVSYWIDEMQPIVLNGLYKVEKGDLSIGGLIDLSAPYHFHENIISYGVQNLRRIFQGGATLALGNDGGVPPLSQAMIQLELSLLSLFLNESKHKERVFDSIELLKTATINSALSLGVEDERGSISEGKIADLVIYDKNPLLFPEIVGGKVSGLLVNGEIVVDKCGLQNGAVV